MTSKEHIIALQSVILRFEYLENSSTRFPGGIKHISFCGALKNLMFFQEVRKPCHYACDILPFTSVYHTQHQLCTAKTISDRQSEVLTSDDNIQAVIDHRVVVSICFIRYKLSFIQIISNLSWTNENSSMLICRKILKVVLRSELSTDSTPYFDISVNQSPTTFYRCTFQRLCD